MSIAACPNCGSRLHPVIRSWDSAPWLCDTCRRGYWTRELHADAQLAFRPGFHDYGEDGFGLRTMPLALKEERAAAFERGISITEDMLGRLSKAQLQALDVFLSRLDLTGRPLLAAFLSEVLAALNAVSQ